MPANSSIFKTPESEKQYFELYEVILAKLVLPSVPKAVSGHHR